MTPLFSQEEVRKAGNNIREMAQLPINRVVRFYNALRNMLTDAQRKKNNPTARLYFALDTTEVVAGISYKRQALSSFSFGDFFTYKNADSDKIRNDLEIMDKLIVNHLLFDGNSTFLLLNSHADELRSVRDGLQNKINNAEEKERELFAKYLISERQLDPFKGYSLSELVRIKDFIERASPTERNKEWKRFTDVFLPHWNRELISSYVQKHDRLRSFDSFVDNGKYCFLRKPNFGERSITSMIPDFKWADFEVFATHDDQIKVKEEIVQTIKGLILLVERQRDRNSLENAAQRDAEAFADLHLINSFLEQSGLDARVELISRSPTLHTVLNALPAGRMHFTIRHPLMIPEVYDFEPDALLSIAELAQKIGGIIKSYLPDATSVLTPERTERIESLKDAFMHHPSNEYIAAGKAACGILPTLSAFSSIQRSLQENEENFLSIYKGTKSKSENSDDVVGREIRAIFSLLTDRLAKGTDPFTREAMRVHVEKNVTLAEYELGKHFKRDEHITCRVLFITDSKITPKPCAVIRVEHGFTRLFLLHSERLIEELKEYFSTRASDQNIIELPVSLFKKSMMIVLRQLEPSKKGGSNISEPDIQYHLNVTLLMAIAFATKERYYTALKIVSTVLQAMAQILRQGGEATVSINKLLCYRELYLFRHYCERVVAVSEYFNVPVEFNFFKGGVARGFAQAQRDIDIATYLSELSEKTILREVEIEGRGDVSEADPAGGNWLEDYRLRLAHMSSWMDMHLMLQSTSHFHELRVDSIYGLRTERKLREIHARKDIWVAVGLVKEASVDARRALDRRLKAAHNAPKNAWPHLERYYAHAEMRALQNCLAMFVLLLATKGVPELEYFWHETEELKPERVLAFREWEDWWARAKRLQEEYGFGMRMSRLIDRVCYAIKQIDMTRSEINSGQAEKKETCVRIKKELFDYLEEMFVLNSAGVWRGGGFIFRLSLLLREKLKGELNSEQALIIH